MPSAYWMDCSQRCAVRQPRCVRHSSTDARCPMGGRITVGKGLSRAAICWSEMGWRKATAALRYASANGACSTPSCKSQQVAGAAGDAPPYHCSKLLRPRNKPRTRCLHEAPPRVVRQASDSQKGLAVALGDGCLQTTPVTLLQEHQSGTSASPHLHCICLQELVNDAV